MGNTPYVCTQVDIPADFNYFIPSSLLSSWRRQIVESLQAKKTIPTLCSTPGGETSREEASPAPLMQCRYCLRHELGYCVKHGGRKAAWHEPLFLRLGDGRRFRLEFNCSECQMNVVAAFGLNDK